MSLFSMFQYIHLPHWDNYMSARLIPTKRLNIVTLWHSNQPNTAIPAQPIVSLEQKNSISHLIKDWQSVWETSSKTTIIIFYFGADTGV